MKSHLYKLDDGHHRVRVPRDLRLWCWINKMVIRAHGCGFIFLGEKDGDAEMLLFVLLY